MGPCWVGVGGHQVRKLGLQFLPDGGVGDDVVGCEGEGVGGCEGAGLDKYLGFVLEVGGGFLLEADRGVAEDVVEYVGLAGWFATCVCCGRESVMVVGSDCVDMYGWMIM